MSSGKLVLGLSGNTQSIGATIIDLATGKVIASFSLDYLKAGIARQFGLNGSFFGDGEGGWYWSPVMTAMGLEEVLDLCKEELGTAMADIVAISGGFHQHARFDMRPQAATAILEGLDPQKSLAPQLVHMCAGLLFPSWMHSSAGPEAEEIAQTLGGHQEAARITGSAVTPRFPAAVIRRQIKYGATGRWPHDVDMHSGSSFLPSLLKQGIAPLCRTEATAWNITGITDGEWSLPICNAIGPMVLPCLPKLTDPFSCVGTVGPYFQERFGLSRDCRVIAFSGDNIVSLLGNGVTKPGMATISLGTSWTVCDNTADPTPDPSLCGHVMRALTGDYMRMTCQTNGGLTLKCFRNEAGLDLEPLNEWGEFDRILSLSTPNPDHVVLPFFFHESLGNRPEGVVCHGFEKSSVKELVPAAVYSLFTHLSLATSGFLGDFGGKTIFGTGGGSRSRPLLQAAANVFGASITPSTASDTVALGGAMMAAMGFYLATGDAVSSAAIPALFAQHAEPVHPDPAVTDSVAALRRNFIAKL